MLFSKRIVAFILIQFIVLTVANAQLEGTSSNLPLIIINTDNQEIVDEPEILAHMGIVNNQPEKRNRITDPFNNYNGKILIEIRGYSSQSYPKKQYKIETIYNDSSNNNVALLGLPEENDWVLYAPYSDKSLIRNVLAYNLHESFGHYAPRTRFCELIINDEYLGVYVLTEKIKRDKNRVDLAKLKPKDNCGESVSGGYLLQIDRSGSCIFNAENMTRRIGIEYPKCHNITNQQNEYITNYISNFDQKLFSENYIDTVHGYKSYINVNSCIDYLLINELAKNIDAYRLSTYMYKNKESNGGKLCFGPVWDFNIAFGNADYRNGYSTDSILASNYVWWNRFLQDTTFNNRLKKRWFELRKKQLSNTHIINLIDSLAGIVNEAQARNFYKWDILGHYIWPNYYIGQTYKAEINFLKSWIVNRLNWLDVNIPGNIDNYTPYTSYKSTVFPNPYTYFFTYLFTINETSMVNIKILDSRGIVISSLVNKQKYDAGTHKLTFSGNNSEYLKPNSLYFILLELNNTVVSCNKIIKQY